MYLFLGGNGAVVAISPEDGREVWRTSLVPVVEKKFFTLSVTVTDYVVTVLDHEAQVFALNSGRLYALDAASGNILWDFNFAESKRRGGVSMAISGKSIKPEIRYSSLALLLAIVAFLIAFR